MKTYQAQQGDTLFAIAQHEYGDGDLYPVIAAQNHLADPALIEVGQELLIPYVTYRHLFATADSDTARKEITQLYYNTADRNVQLIWEVVNGVAQREIHQGGRGCNIPDLANGGHHTGWWRTNPSRAWLVPLGTATSTLRRSSKSSTT